jgi:major membrane immunogen (membrane-anchored lipoprotein)
MANRQRISFVIILSLLFLGCTSAQSAEGMYDGMYSVSLDEDNVMHIVESTTIATPGPGRKIATVYEVEEVGIGHIETWEFRCKDLTAKLLSDHDYEQFADGTWGERDSPPTKDDVFKDFVQVTAKESQGQVAQFVCRWPNLAKGEASADLLPSMPADPTARIQFMIKVRILQEWKPTPSKQ